MGIEEFRSFLDSRNASEAYSPPGYGAKIAAIKKEVNSDGEINFPLIRSKYITAEMQKERFNLACTFFEILIGPIPRLDLERTTAPDVEEMLKGVEENKDKLTPLLQFFITAALKFKS